MSQQPDEFDVPPGLADALRGAYAHRVEIPQAVDDSVLAAARESFERRQRTRLMIRWGTGLAAGLAAVIALAVVLHRPTSETVKTLAIKGDINADGQVNMVDALLLAKHVAANDQPERAWDANNDGAIDQKDVDAIAAVAVNLKQTGLARGSLPRLRELGLDRIRVGSALADVPRPKTFAKANPTENPTGHSRQEARP